ncbi:hypothetical protein DUI87_24579 [Hirundo rustica rustica]|uniref:Uncharacterized protein n=1 Tax=Hirundo rustica rustica TaxID=333673 RepID=A0A3M0JJ15_HIRRU|nr:hypothetical protein DUI87_24579 [Hirundo rustica rustica]
MINFTLLAQYIKYWEGILHWYRVPRAAWVPGSAQGQVGHWGLEQPGMVEDVPAMARGGMGWDLTSLPTIPLGILGFCVDTRPLRAGNDHSGKIQCHLLESWLLGLLQECGLDQQSQTQAGAELCQRLHLVFLVFLSLALKN